MNKHHTIIGISLLVGTFFVSGCNVKEPQIPKKATQKSEQPKEQITKDPAKSFSDKHSQISTDISKTEEKIDSLEKKISETPLGTERAKLVKSRTQLEKKIVSLKSQQIENAKASRASKLQ